MSPASFRIPLLLAIIAVNGFFAAAEVSLVSVRQSRLRQMAEEGRAGAQAALALLGDPGRLLSVTQVGVTLASLGLGWVGEDTVYQLLMNLLHPALTPLTERFFHGASLAVSFLAISYLHVVIGEVVPKNLAIAKADRLALLVAPVLQVFCRVALPFVAVIERSARAITRVLKLESDGHAGGHSSEELKLIVSSSRGLGYLPESQEDIIHRVLDLDAIAVREVMVPRNDIISIPANASLDAALTAMTAKRHSRLPVYQDSPEKIVGILHYQDLLAVWEERRRLQRLRRPTRPFRLERLLRPHLVVPETKPLAQMLEEFRVRRAHIAMVVDEYGTIIGMLTMEDVFAQLVGRIEDEYADKTPGPGVAGRLELDGATRIRDLEGEYGIAIPTDAGFETLAGFLLFRLGEIPAAGQSVVYEGRQYTVIEMDRHRISRVRIETLPETAEQPVSEAS